MGHSLGGAVASLYASLFADKLDRLLLIDGLGPILSKDDEARENLLKAITSRSKIDRKKSRKYQDINTAIKATADSRGISLENAELLVNHHIKKSEKGYNFTYDHKLKYSSPLRITAGQFESFVKEISVKTLIITVENGYLVNSPQWQITKTIKHLTVSKVDGPHHFHMERPKQTAKIIKSFLKDS